MLMLPKKPKNLFDIDNPVYSANSLENLKRKPENRNGVIYFNTWYANAGGAGFVVPMPPNTTFTISFEKVEGEWWTEFFNFESIGSNGLMQNWARFTNYKNVTSVQYTQPAGKHYILLLLACVGGYKKAGVKNLQVVIGGEI